MWWKIAGCAALWILAGCSESAPDLGFTKPDAERFLQTLAREVQAGNAAGVAPLCRAPLRLRSRTWPTAADISKNLPSVLGEWKEELASAQEMTVYTHADLVAGNWPRGRSIPEQEREAEALRLGVLPGGFLVRTGAAGKAGQLWALAPEGVTRLLLVAVH